MGSRGRGMRAVSSGEDGWDGSPVVFFVVEVSGREAVDGL